MRIIAPSGALAALSLLLAACASGSVSPSIPPAAASAVASAASAIASAAGAAVPAACDVVTTAEVQAALGGTVAAGKAQQIAQGDTSCDFGGVLVRVRGGSDAAFLAGIKNSFSDAVDVPAVGDAAFYSKQNATFGFVKGSTFVLIQAPNANDQAKLAALAAAVAAKL
jgi:hypothetical protein